MSSHLLDQQHIRSALEKEVSALYRKLIASRYFTKGQLEMILSETDSMIVKKFPNHYLLASFIFLDEISQLSIESGRYEENERRFLHFYEASIESLLTYLKENKEDSTSVIDLTLDFFMKRVHQHDTPWSYLLKPLYLLLTSNEKEYIYKQIMKQSLPVAQLGPKTRLVLSYIYLDQNQTDEALTIIRSLTHLQAVDFLPHFELLKQQNQWRIMNKWFQSLFNLQAHYGSLQTLHDEMNMRIFTNPTDQKQIWDRWLQAPHFTRFEALTQFASEQQKKEIAHYLLPKLKERLFLSEALITYARILIDFEHYDEAAHFFMTYEKEPFRLQKDKVKLLDLISKKRPNYAKAIYHQFAVRLIEKKTRAHYEQAVVYIQELKQLYEQTESIENFQRYLFMLRQKYKTYRAFIEELKKIG
ncbi:hypothetical protein BTS2_0907 [Bacillus sp. TS-2]|nr:hypothetical protein BTS2_0907 [Bacillus sp. TS-2]